MNQLTISTHALTEGDDTGKPSIKEPKSFQLTPSQRATPFWRGLDQLPRISTHALTEGDLRFSRSARVLIYFNSRPHRGRPHGGVLYSSHTYFNSRPHRGRPNLDSSELRQHYFNSRPHRGRPAFPQATYVYSSFQLTPSQRATGAGETLPSLPLISTHALTEGDGAHRAEEIHETNFNSRPHRGRRVHFIDDIAFIGISTHALTEGDAHDADNETVLRISTHALTEGDGGRIRDKVSRIPVFQLTPSQRATR